MLIISGNEMLLQLCMALRWKTNCPIFISMHANNVWYIKSKHICLVFTIMQLKTYHRHLRTLVFFQLELECAKVVQSFFLKLTKINSMFMIKVHQNPQ